MRLRYWGQERRTTSIRLPIELPDATSVIQRLNDRRDLVAADQVDDMILVRPVRQPLLAGIPAYYSSRPIFRGRVDREPGGRVVLHGAVERADLLPISNVIGLLFVAFVSMIGIALLRSGDLSGIVAILVAVVAVIALLVQSLLNARLSDQDEHMILAALKGISDQA